MSRLLTLPNLALGVIASVTAALGTYAILSAAAHASSTSSFATAAPACTTSTGSQNEVYFVSCGGFF